MVLNKYTVYQLTALLQKHNKHIRTGESGLYLPYLSKAKKSKLVEFINANFTIKSTKTGHKITSKKSDNDFVTKPK